MREEEDAFEVMVLLSQSGVVPLQLNQAGPLHRGRVTLHHRQSFFRHCSFFSAPCTLLQTLFIIQLRYIISRSCALDALRHARLKIHRYKAESLTASAITHRCSTWCRPRPPSRRDRLLSPPPTLQRTKSLGREPHNTSSCTRSSRSPSFPRCPSGKSPNSTAANTHRTG